MILLSGVPLTGTTLSKINYAERLKYSVAQQTCKFSFDAFFIKNRGNFCCAPTADPKINIASAHFIVSYILMISLSKGRKVKVKHASHRHCDTLTY